MEQFFKSLTGLEGFLLVLVVMFVVIKIRDNGHDVKKDEEIAALKTHNQELHDDLDLTIKQLEGARTAYEQLSDSMGNATEGEIVNDKTPVKRPDHRRVGLKQRPYSVQ